MQLYERGMSDMQWYFEVDIDLYNSINLGLWKYVDM